MRFRGEGGVALARSGRGVVATATGQRHVTLRARRRDGRFGSPRRHRALREGRVGIAGVAINDRGVTAVACTRGFEYDPRSLLVLAGGRPRIVRRARGGRFGPSPVHVDARGRVRAIFVAGGRVRAWRG